MEEKQKYVCPLCCTEYDTPKAMAHCVLECEEKRRAEKERIRREQLSKERDKRWDEVVEASKKYSELYRKFVNDYADEWGIPTSFWDSFWNS